MTDRTFFVGGGGDRRALWWRATEAMAVPLGLGFALLGGAKLNSPAAFQESFIAWGLSPALIPWTGGVEAVLGLATFYRGTRTAGAMALALWMVAAAAVHIALGQARLTVLPGGLAVVAGAVAWSGLHLGHPPRLRVPTPLDGAPESGLAGFGFMVRLVGVSMLVRWMFGGIVFWLSLPLLAVVQARAGGSPARAEILRTVLLYLLVLGLGVTGVWGFVGHRFLSDDVARSIGWATGSPFQHELAFYHLGMGVVGLLCYWIRDHFWVAAGITPSIFALGAGTVHVQELLLRENWSPGNWGPGVLFGNLLIPLTVLGLVAWYARSEGAGRAARDHPG